MNEHQKRQQARAEQETGEPVQIDLGHGISLENNAQANRTRLFFPGKPPDPVRAELKRSGFRWSRTIGAWQRHLSPVAERTARDIVATHYPEEA